MNYFLKFNGKVTTSPIMMYYALDIHPSYVNTAIELLISSYDDLKHNFDVVPYIFLGEEQEEIEKDEYRLTLEGLVLVIKELEDNGFKVSKKGIKKLKMNYLDVLDNKEVK